MDLGKIDDRKLVGGLEHEFLWLSHHIGNIIIPTDELHHFSEGWVNHQPGRIQGHPKSTSKEQLGSEFIQVDGDIKRPFPGNETCLRPPILMLQAISHPPFPSSKKSYFFLCPFLHPYVGWCNHIKIGCFNRIHHVGWNPHPRARRCHVVFAVESFVFVDEDLMELGISEISLGNTSNTN
jgi:hypothetical protein